MWAARGSLARSMPAPPPSRTTGKDGKVGNVGEFAAGRFLSTPSYHPYRPYGPYRVGGWWINPFLPPLLTLRSLPGGRVVVPRDGIEPPTRGFSVLCSTN